MAGLPDCEDLLVACDSETSGLHVDSGSRVAVVSWAYREPTKHAQRGWIQKPDAEIVRKAVAFDQGVVDLPLGDKDLETRHLRRINKTKPMEAWIGGEPVEVIPQEWFHRPAPNLDPKWFDVLVSWFACQKVIYHNAKFDMQHIRAGLRGRGGVAQDGGDYDLESSFWWDTQLAQAVLDPRFGTSLKPTSERLNLGAAVGIEKGHEADEQRALGPWRGPMTGKNADPRYDLIPWEVMDPYATGDPLLTLLLAEYQGRLLDEGEGHWWSHIARQFDLMIALYRMENRGVGFDADGCRVERDRLEIAKGRVAQALPFDPTPDKARVFFFGDPDDDDETKRGLGVIPRSDKMTDGGKPQVDEEVIHALAKHADDRVREVAGQYEQHEEIKSAISKWYGAWPEFVGEDGRLRTNYRQAKVVSGRLSAERVQLQAIPHDYQLPDLMALGASRPLRSIREFFVPRDGYALWELDVANAEPRIATMIARCQPMYQAVVIDGQDTHSAATLLMFAGEIGEDEDGNEFGPGHADWTEYRQVGKRAQPLDEPVATPTGWRPIGDLQPGDLVIGSDGRSTKVEAIAYEGDDEVWEVTTRTGRVVRACADHRWTVQNARGTEFTVPTRQLTDTDYLPRPVPVEFDPVDLPLDPYTLGALLGDGSWKSNPKLYANIEDGREIAGRMAAGTGDTVHVAPYAANPDAARFALHGGNAKRGLAAIGLDPQPATADKYVPGPYLRGSVEQRYELLRGLMDTDGSATADGKYVFSSTSQRLVESVAELVRSLGGSATISQEWRPSDKDWSPSWRASLRTPECPFALIRKVERWKPPKHLRDRIAEVRPAGSAVRMRCITVSAEDGLYLTRDYVQTHNCNLGILYAAGPATIRDQIRKFTGIDYPLSQVRPWVEQYKKAFPQFVGATDYWSRFAESNGYVRLINGRLRYFASHEPLHKGFNQVIQGSVAETMTDAMIGVEAAVPDAMLLQVHDSLVCEVPIGAEGVTQFALAAATVRHTFEQAFTLRWREGEAKRFMPFPVDSHPFGRTKYTTTKDQQAEMDEAIEKAYAEISGRAVVAA